MALGDYILCCKCDVKLIYDGDKGNREWWEERFGSEPAILCPNCDKRPWVGLTGTEKHELRYSHMTSAEFIDAIEAALRSKNT
jgi:hypothetical protein